MLGQSRAIEVEAPPLPALPPPLPLSRIVGQGRAVGLLEDAIASKKLHHAWIFEGPEGVGKCTAAFAFASLLLDPTTECGLSGGVVCDESSPAQRLLRAGTHPDLQLITRELSAYHPDAVVRKKKQTNIPIDVVRHFVIAMGGLAPSAPTSMQSLARKVFIIDEADYMETASQNAILKYLEEPPPQVVLVLVCSSPHLLLPTIRSRCQRVGFTTLSRGQLDHWLSDAQERGEVPELSPQHREFLLGFADGAPGLLLRAVQGGVHHWYDTLAKPLGDAAQGIHTAELGGMMSGFIDTWAKAQVEQNDRISKQNANSVAAGWLFRLLSWHARQRLQRQATELATLGPDAPEPRALRDIDALQAAQAELEANCNMQMVMEKLSAELAGG
jgi:DNA polymerase-3 subunit delta'